MSREPLLRRVVGGILRARRTAQGRTLRSVAAQARVSVAYLSEIERGRKEPSSEVLGALCGALGIGLVDLLADAHHALVGHPPMIDLSGRASSTVIGRAGPVDQTTVVGSSVLLHAA